MNEFFKKLIHVFLRDKKVDDDLPKVLERLRLDVPFETELTDRFSQGDIFRREFFEVALDELTAKLNLKEPLDVCNKLIELLTNETNEYASLIGQITHILEPAYSQSPEYTHIQKSLTTMKLEIIDRLDNGEFASIYKVLDKTTLATYVVRSFNVKRWKEKWKDANHTDAEYNIYRDPAKIDSSPHIIRLIKKWVHTIEVEGKVDPITPADSEQPATSPKFEFLLLEYYEVDLDTWMNQNPDRDIQFFKGTIILQVLKGLEFLHDQKIVHRNLKPSNIFLKNVDNKVSVKIGDFSIYREISEEEYREDSRKREMLQNYRAPEMLHESEGDPKPAVDIYSLGLIYVVLLTEWNNYQEIINMINLARRQELDLIIPESERSIVKEMLANNPEKRILAKDAISKLEGSIGLPPPDPNTDLEEIMDYEEDTMDL